MLDSGFKPFYKPWRHVHCLRESHDWGGTMLSTWCEHCGRKKTISLWAIPLIVVGAVLFIEMSKIYTQKRLKTLLVIVASALGGFYLGGQYAGRMAAATYTFSKPAWMVEVQETLTLALIACGVAAAVWILMDYRE